MEDVDLGGARSLNLPRVGQLGFVVDSIQNLLPYYASFYGLDTWFEPKYASKEFRVGGRRADLDMDLTFAYSGKVQIELIETKGQEENLYHRHLAQHGGGF